MTREDLIFSSDDALYTSRYYLRKKINFINPYCSEFAELTDLYNRVCDEIARREKVEEEIYHKQSLEEEL